MRDVLERLTGRRVLVVGDVMLDRSIVGPAARISPEAPVPVVAIHHETDGLGGAANVAAGVRALGATPVLVGVTGRDAERDRMLELLADADIGCDRLVAVDDRPTTVKTRIVAGHQQIARVDREEVGDVADAALDETIRAALADSIDAVVISDYAKGVLTDDALQLIIGDSARRGIPVVVDPKGDDPGRYRGATLVTPNLTEFVSWVRAPIGRNDLDEVALAAVGIAARHDFGAVAVTLGGSGVLICPATGDPVHVPGHPIEVFDVTGAGDTVVATIGAAMAAGVDLPTAIELANHAGAVAVSRSGTSVVGRVDLGRELDARAATALVDHADLLSMVARWKSRRQRIVFTNGCFDVLHAGHLALLAAARREGDVLVVGLNSDDSVRRLKGPDRPLVAAADRGAVLAAIRGVNAVVVFDADDPAALVEAIRPDVIVKGGDYTAAEVIGADVVERHGGRVVIVPTEPGYSTTSLVSRVRES